VKPLDQWPFWERAVFTNVIAAAGVYIGFALSDVKPSAVIEMRIGVFVFAFMNLMFLVVRPRIRNRKAVGGVGTNPWSVIYEVLAERPLVTALLFLQLWETARAASTTIVFMQASASDVVRSLPNAHSMTLRLIGSSVLMASVAILWLLGAIGLWRNYSWVWWLALVLNGLTAIVGLVIQFLKPDVSLLDPFAMAAVLLLMLRPVRDGFRGNKRAVNEAAV
jgi:uncharacterized membrane protein (DUF2068 family)